ncbi:SWPV1-279 [Shearwaterpox virus]|uniref:SWPV1-279 n=1 Tax=Shearwaterpox virus TaxID=1974596 RepID=A0A1V0S891_CNPV|nr:SWPV1-279 [Shearwaterpox virus]
MIDYDSLYKILDSNSNNINIMELVKEDLFKKSVIEKQNMLIRSVISNNIYFTNLLLNNKTEVNFYTANGYTVLHSAVMQSSRTTRLLLNNGADPNVRHEVHGSPLNRLISKYKKSKIIKLLLKYKADTNITDSNGYTALHLAIYYNRNYEIVKLLLDNGANINAICKHGTVLHLATCNQNIKITKLLLDYGADPNITDVNGLSPLYKTAISNRRDIAKLLLDYGADVNIKCRKGRTALHGAVIWKRSKLVITLLRYGADINSIDKSMKTPLTCIQLNDNRTGKILVSHIVLLQHKLSSIIYNEGFIYNTTAISRHEELLKIKQICNEELLNMKSVRLAADITIDMLLTAKNKNIFIRYIDNPIINTCINNAIIYHNDLVNAVRDIQHRDMLINKAILSIDMCLYSTLWNVLPHYIKYSILELLTNSELELIC